VDKHYEDGMNDIIPFFDSERLAEEYYDSLYTKRK